MLSKQVTVEGKRFSIRLPEDASDMATICFDKFSLNRAMQIALHQRQLTYIQQMLKGGYSQKEIQGLLETYTYRARGAARGEVLRG